MPAIALEVGIELTMDRFTAIAGRTPHLTLLKPAGKYFPRDLYEASGMAALMDELNRHGKIHPGCLTVNGRTIGENIAGGEITNEDVIHRVEGPISLKGGVCILYGSLAPEGCVVKSAAVVEEKYLS